jgi:hypothetical protein
LAFAAAAFVLFFAVLFTTGEIAVRLYRGALFSAFSARRTTYRVLASLDPAVYDPELGYAPRPGARGENNRWGVRVTIDAAGLRVGHHAAAGKEPCILAVGDSYTFGDGVNDDETWPYYLEELLRRPVINGGVFGYGLDQIVLRAEKLLAARRVEVMIVSIIPDDVRRCEFSYRFAAKPYFDIVGGRLGLRNVPVPPPAPRRDGLLLSVLGFSHLADAVFTRVAPEFWLDQTAGTVSANRSGRDIAYLLIDRIQQATANHGARLVLVVQGHPPFDDREWVEPIISQAELRGIMVLDLYSMLRDLLTANPFEAPSYFNIHMTPLGNRWVAEQIASRIRTMTH